MVQLENLKDLIDELKGEEKSDKMVIEHTNKRKRGLTTGSSDPDYPQHMSENGEPPYKKRKTDDMTSIKGVDYRQQAKSLYTVQNHCDVASKMISNDPEESEERK